MPDTVLFAFVLTIAAGLSTGIGSAIALFARRTSTGFLSVSLGFSAGVMIWVSFTELLVEATRTLQDIWGHEPGASWATVSFFAGIAVIAIIDHLVPEPENPHALRSIEDMNPDAPIHDAKLERMGILTAIAIAVHNFPEGIATFAAALSDPSIGIPIAIAIALHNIPEGIAVSVPIFFATGNRKKAFWLSFASGLSEPLGAALGYLLLRAFFTEATMGVLLAAVAGVMVFISLDELLPAAREYGKPHLAIYGLVAGMAVMAISLLLLG